MCFNFVCLASSHRECVYNSVLALHIDTTALSDGTYELIPDSEGGDLEPQANIAVLTKAPDITYISNYYHLLLLFAYAFTVLRS